MTDGQWEVLKEGDDVFRQGFFTKRHCLGDPCNGYALERRLGYAPGRLRFGWYLLLLLDRPPDADEFVFAGYTHFSGGRIRGHAPEPGERGPAMEAALHAEGIDVAARRRDTASRFSVIGPERIAKIVPRLRDLDDAETSILRGKYWNPSPEPIPQWILTVPRRFHVERFFPGPV
jgi:hypothetical protein